MNNRNTKTRNTTLVGFGVALNIIGAFIAVNLKLPIYMDSIGTIFVAALLGPKYAVMTGLLGSFISGVFDPFSLYFAPVQISTGLISGIMYEKGFLNGTKKIIGVLAFAIPTALISASIAAYVFDGVTSAGSSYIVQILNALGAPKIIVVFIIQIITDYADKFLAVVLVGFAIKSLPKNLVQNKVLDYSTKNTENDLVEISPCNNEKDVLK